jgi:hypothetical protein
MSWLKSMMTNWTTSVPAALATLCGAVHLADVLPEIYSKYLIAACGFFVAIGLFAAKSAGVTNSKDPGAAVAVSYKAAATPNPAATPPAVK